MQKAEIRTLEKSVNSNITNENNILSFQYTLNYTDTRNSVKRYTLLRQTTNRKKDNK